MATGIDLAGDAAPAAPAGAAAPRAAPGARPVARDAPGARWARVGVTGLCWALVLAQLVLAMAWSWHLLDRANLSWDFGIYYQPWYLVAHGHLLARNTFQGGYLFMRNDGELIVYVLAPLYWLFPNHQLGYLWLQDLAVAGSSAVCLAMVVDALPWRVRARWREQAVAGAARLTLVLLLVANPFVYWVVSFDVHMEVFGAFFALLTLRAALRQRRSTALWALLTACCGAAAVLYVVGVGLAATVVLVWRHRHALSARRELLQAGWPLALSVLALVWLAGLGLAHATVGSPAYAYAYLTSHGAHGKPSLVAVGLGVLEHPATAYRVVASHGWNLWANTSPDGFVGLLSPAFFIAAPSLLTNNLLESPAFSYPSFQNFVVYGAVALGSVGVLATLWRRRLLWPLGAALGCLLLANAFGWAYTWDGSLSGEWMHMSDGSAAVVEQVAHEAKAADEVVASQGYVGLLAGRQQVYSFSGPTVVPVRSRTLWFVLSYTQGGQVATQAETLEAIDTVAHLPGVQTLHFDDNGMYVYRWNPPAGVRSVALGEPGSPYPIWMVPGPQVAPITSGPPSGWSVSTDGQTVYLVVNDYFQLQPGRYVAEVRFQSDGPVTPEVWNLNTGEIITGTKSGVTAHRATVVRLPFTVPAPTWVPGVIQGSGIFIDQPIPTERLATVEVRIWVPGGAIARAWWTAVKPA